MALPHVFIDPRTQQVTGIIDFGDLRSDHATWDFAWLWLFESATLEPVLRGYGTPPRRLEDALYLFGLQRLVGELAWLHQERLDIADRPDRIRALIQR